MINAESKSLQLDIATMTTRELQLECLRRSLEKRSAAIVRACETLAILHQKQSAGHLELMRQINAPHAFPSAHKKTETP